MALYFSENQKGIESGCIEFEANNSSLISKSLGRSPENDICITSQVVSRRHCEFIRYKGIWHVADNGSRYRTWVQHTQAKQGHWLQPNDWFPLENGTRILFGGPCGIRSVWLDSCDETLVPPHVFEEGWPLCMKNEKPVELPTEPLPEIDNAWELVPWAAGWVESRFGKIGLFVLIAVAIAILTLVLL